MVVTQSSPLPLSGVRVLDFSHAGAGPFATMQLADLGAEVVKIEKPGRGDGSRFMGELVGDEDLTDYYVGLNRSKASLALDLGTEQGREIAGELVEWADVVVENFRPGVMGRLGLGFNDVAERKPGIVYCSISGFGPHGPWRQKPANDITIQGMSGLMSVTGEEGGDPVRVGAPICDFTAGLYATIAVLAALPLRREHPEGQHVQVYMVDAAISLMANYVASAVPSARPVPRRGRGHAQIVPYQAFKCRDGRFVIVGAFSQGFWRRLATRLGRSDWITDPRFRTNADRLAHREELIAAMEAIFAERTRDEWVEAMSDVDVPVAPVYELYEAATTEQADVSGTLLWLDSGTARPIPVAGTPVRSSSWGQREHRFPSHVGDESEAVLAGILGRSMDAIQQLAQERVVELRSEEGRGGDAARQHPHVATGKA